MAFNLKQAQQVMQGPAAGLYQWALQNMYIEPGTPPEVVVEMAQKAKAEAETAGQVADIIEENTVMNEEVAENTDRMKNIIPQAVPAPQEMGAMAGSKDTIKTFNLKKAQGIGEAVTPLGDVAADDIDMMGDQFSMEQDVLGGEQDAMGGESPKFQDGADLKDWLDQKDFNTARNLLLTYIADTAAQQLVEDGLNSFYEGDLDQNGKIKIAVSLFDVLPDQLKFDDMSGGDMIPAEYTRAMIEETNETIKKLAEEHVKKAEKKPFNLNKEAQHKVVEDTFMYGPGQTRIDPYYRMPVSDYHIIERNKGYGIDFGGVWDVDWEAIWRSSIMDKYSRPYKDKDGNWVGGYIQKRFEVDKNIPEQNNMQLKPGQTRKPVLPEYGSTEARLQSARADGDVEGANNTDAPFNWKEASAKKKS
ncbi:hypothetical protein CMI37_35570 [Candidatus Pacearchaeota archaeon]|nr:hypothetical protein [Candidatus Pacearchaeota archaeon]|tara:strand:- start:6523 stop:7773 length:1251 start_codon:yes stop_codon:yes gene_type:complete